MQRPSNLNSEDVKRYSRQLGFTLTGIVSATPKPEAAFLSEWLQRGYAGEMHYLERGKDDRLDATRLAPPARSIVVCAMNYNADRPYTPTDRLRAWISRYAWGLDYHDVMLTRLRELADWIDQRGGGKSRSWVDTGPVLERVFAKYAGIGWFGKNTCIIREGTGSWFFLGCILTDQLFDYDAPPPDRCGSCVRCLEACPTGALVAPYVLDSRKCISYQTIELRGSIPESDRAGIGHHLFGCDICQDVCPWNRKAPVSEEPAFDPREGLYWPELETLLDRSDDEWRRLIRGTAMKRAKVKGLIRNLMVVVGNSGARHLASRLERFLEHEDPVVREHAEWAMRKLCRGGL
ncbi:MAG TPA: tRNA epoxyqueuosine(34) reductase QueG [Terriglobia bacterium]|nr:tRNA epoxyqueuosine(34) reductase QueG [Terriglobia bacterium]